MQRLRRAFCGTLLLLAVCQNGYGELFAFNIPAQKLASALDEFATASGAEVFFSPEATAGKNSHAVEGHLSSDEALLQLLQGTGLEFIRAPNKAYVIRPVPPVTSTEPQATETAPLKIEEIIVTSQHRSESLHKVPISITSLTRETLQEIDASDIYALSLHIPGLFFSEFSLGQPLIRMRGIGTTDDGAGSDIPVALYVDDVYVGRMTTINVALFDVERIEVLRGPQGTLFGRNTSAGAINITTPRPSEGLQLNLTAGAGNLDHRLLKGDIGGPLLAERLSGRVAFIHDETAGYQRNITTGDKQQGGETTAFRGQLQFSNNANATLLLSGDYSLDNIEGTGRIPADPNHPSRQIFDAHGGDPRRALNGDAGFSDRRNYGLTSRLDVDIGETLLTSISAWRRGEFDYQEDSTGLNTMINNPDAIVGIAPATALEVTDNVFETTRQFTQEFRLTSATDQRVSWVAGMYYLRQHVKRLETFYFNALNVIEQINQDNLTESLSLYGDIRIALQQELNLTIGMRRSFERKEISQSALDADLIFDESYQIATNDTWQNASPRLVLDYSPIEGLMLYTSIAKGFKSGGYQGQAPSAIVAQNSFDEEIVTNYELGAKFRSLNGRARVDTSYFHADYDDMQIAMFTGLSNTSNSQGFFLTSNAAESFLRGYEVEVSLILTPALEVSGSYAKIRGEFSDFIDANGIDREGTEMTDFPNTMSVLTARYTHRFKDGASLRFRLDRRYQSTAYRSFPNNPLDAIRAYRKLDAYVSYTTPQEDWELNLWVRNLTDELYQRHSTFVDAPYDLYASPRTFGVSLTWHYSP